MTGGHPYKVAGDPGNARFTQTADHWLGGSHAKRQCSAVSKKIRRVRPCPGLSAIKVVALSTSTEADTRTYGMALVRWSDSGVHWRFHELIAGKSGH